MGVLDCQSFSYIYVKEKLYEKNCNTLSQELTINFLLFCDLLKGANQQADYICRGFFKSCLGFALIVGFFLCVFTLNILKC